MLKHASNASAAAPANGQLMRSSNSNGSNTPSALSGAGPPTITTTSPSATAASILTTTAAATAPLTTTVATAAATAAVNTTARNIHLRPPQPLNLSALNASASGGACGALYNNASRGGVASTLLNVATPPPIAPIKPMTPNGNCHNSSLHHHTYTNQHMLASSAATATAATAAGCQLGTLHSPHSKPALQQHSYNNLSTPHSKMPKHGPGPREALTSLGLLCLVSLLLALLSLIFLLKISPNSREDALARNVSSDDFIIVYDVTLALCALSLSLNLCCLLVCAIQFLFAVKLVRSPMFDGRDNRYLEKSSASRTCAVSGFFVSIPVFLTGLILYTFNHFHSTPAIISSVLIGVGIVFCGGAMVHNVFVWQKEKTISYRSGPLNISVLSACQLPAVQLLGAPPPPTSGMGALPPPPQLYPHCFGSQPAMLQPSAVTPVSPNHSHASFNPLLCVGNNNNGSLAFNISHLGRPATATPPTPKPLGNGVCMLGREASGSVSPGIPPTLDMSNMTISLHELSTLV